MFYTFTDINGKEWTLNKNFVVSVEWRGNFDERTLEGLINTSEFPSGIRVKGATAMNIKKWLHGRLG